MSSPGADPTPPRPGSTSVGFTTPRPRQSLVALAVLAMVLGAILLGATLADDFGVSWDETGDAAYGRDSLSSYRDPTFDWDRYGKRKYYGPAHFMFQAALADSLAPVIQGWGEVEGRHFANYLSFLVAVLAFYLLARPFVRPAVAAIATLLFAMQPLYLGHAFINGKDTPFMAFFLLALAAGTRGAMRLRVGGEPPEAQAGRYRSAITTDWRSTRRWIRAILILAVALATVAGLDRWLTRSIAYTPARALVRAAYLDQGPPWLNRLFDRSAESAAVVPLDDYLLGGDRLLDSVLQSAAILFGAAAAALAVWRFARLRSVMWDELRHTSPRSWLGRDHLGWLVLAGIAAGVTISIRSVGVFALLLIAVFYLGIHRARGIQPWLALTVLAAAVAYAAWPFLWGQPIAGLRESIEFLAGNPNKDYVLFMGEVTKGRLLPWFYLPTLMVFQFTEPVWVLVAVGGASFFLTGAPRHRWLLATVLGMWLLMPTVPLILQHAWFYDNFRQFLFVTPALFLLAALGLNGLSRLMQRRGPAVAWWLLAGLLVIPGVVAAVRLHPYEYTYFNGLAGGTRGAFRQFELDYWATSYSAAIRRLNATLPPGATVAFLGTIGPAELYARPDLTLIGYNFDADPSTVESDVIVAMTRANADVDLQRFTCREGEIGIDGAILAVIRSPRPCDPH